MTEQEINELRSLGINDVGTICRIVRSKLACSLKEAADFYMKDRATWVDRMLKMMVESGATGYISVEEQIRMAIRRYYLALDKREHGQVAQDKAFDEIQSILNMTWVQGQELSKERT